MKKRLLILFLLISAMILIPATVFADGETPVKNGWNADRSIYYDETGNPVKGLFKAKMSDGVGALFYADDNGKVVKKKGIVSVSGKKVRFLRSEDSEGHFGFRQVSSTDHKTYTYFIGGNGEGAIAEDSKFYTCSSGKYFVQENGTVKMGSGFVDVDGNRYYVTKNGTARTKAGWIKYKGKRYRAGGKGIVHTKVGAFTLNGRRYVCLADGTICTKKGPVKVNGRLYYVKNKKGVLGGYYSYKLDGKTYHVNKKGVIKIGRHKWKNGKYYYSTKKGYLKPSTGMVTEGNSRFYVKKGGLVVVNQKFQREKWSYVAGKDGTLKKGLFKWKGALLYANDKCALKPKAGIVDINGYKYYVAAGGAVYVNQRFWAGGYMYIADASGHLQSGIVWWNGRYYYIKDDFTVYTKQGRIYYNQKYYYNKDGGGLVRNDFVKIGNSHYYAGSDAAFVTVPFTYNGVNGTVTVRPASDGSISDKDYDAMFKKEKEEDDKKDENAEG